MKRRVLVVGAWLLLATLAVGCQGQYSLNVTGSKQFSVMVGEKVTFSAQLCLTEMAACGDQSETLYDQYAASTCRWSVAPADDAKISSGGVFVATSPGRYTVAASRVVEGKGELDGETWVEVTEDEPTTSTDETDTTEETDTTAVQGSEPIKLFDNHNVLGVDGGGTAPSFKLSSTTRITELETYHYVEGGLPAAGTISLRGGDGKILGPFQATGSDGQGGVANAYWTIKPKDLVLPAGSYTVIDSDPATFSQNEDNGGVGMIRLWGVPQQ
jgi:hypothetical protein